MSTPFTIDTLINQLKNELDELDLTNMTANTVFLEINGWNSLYSLVLMAFISTEYGLDLPAEDIRNIRTVADLHKTITTATT